MMNTKSEFAVTKDLFTAYTGYKEPLTYEQWLETAADRKSAVLFIQFYDTITLAWYKLASVYSTEEDGVAEVLQYLEKNVPLIIKDKKRFNPAYIYRVVYNCLYCLCRDPNKFKKAYENEMSNIAVGSDGDEFDLFDTVGNYDDEMDFEKEQARRRIWDIIDKLCNKQKAESKKDYIIVVASLLGDNLDYTGEYHKADFRPADPKEVEKRIYKKSEDVNPARVEIRKAAIRSKYGEDFVSEEFIEEQRVGKDGKSFVRLKFSVREERPYLGAQAFTEDEINSISSERRAEIVAELADALREIKDILLS